MQIGYYATLFKPVPFQVKHTHVDELELEKKTSCKSSLCPQI